MKVTKTTVKVMTGDHVRFTRVTIIQMY